MHGTGRDVVGTEVVVNIGMMDGDCVGWLCGGGIRAIMGGRGVFHLVCYADGEG